MSGTIFTGQTVQGKAAADWPLVYKACEQFQRFGIEVFDLDTREISEQQRKWLHCDTGPVRFLMAEGWSFKDAKNHLKRTHGRQWFVKYITGENFKNAKGELYWECQIAVCKALTHPIDISYRDGKRRCSICGSPNIKLVAIQSIMDKSVKIINQWFDEIFSAMPKIQPPDKDWKKNLNKET